MHAWWQSFFDKDYLHVWGTDRKERTARETDALWTVLGLHAGARLLDAPCGYGRLSQPLAARGAHVLGVDQSAPMIAHAERNRDGIGGDRLRYRHHDLRAPLDEDGFDAAINIFSSLGYGSEDDDAAILRTLAAAVRPGGKVAIDTMHRDVLAARLARDAVPAYRLPDGTLLLEEARFDPVAGRVQTTWFWAGPKGSGQKAMSVRVYAITELVRLMEQAGLHLEAALHPSGAPFSPAGPTLGGRVLLVGVR